MSLKRLGTYEPYIEKQVCQPEQRVSMDTNTVTDAACYQACLLSLAPDSYLQSTFFNIYDEVTSEGGAKQAICSCSSTCEESQRRSEGPAAHIAGSEGRLATSIISNARARAVCLPIRSSTYGIPKKKSIIKPGSIVKVTIEVSRPELTAIDGSSEETKDTGLLLDFPDDFMFQKSIVGPAAFAVKKMISKPFVLTDSSTLYWEYAPIPGPGKKRKYIAVFKVS